MSLQYLSNNSGQTTGVLISIGDWNQIKAKYPEVNSLEAGILQLQKELADQRTALLEQYHKEPTWVADFSDVFDHNAELQRIHAELMDCYVW